MPYSRSFWQISAHLGWILILFQCIRFSYATTDPILLDMFTLNGMVCKEHPAYFTDINPPLVRSWHFFRSTVRTFQEVYHPRHTQNIFIPRGKPSSTKYKNLDFFYLADPRKKDTNFRMYFQRRAKIYLLIPLNKLHSDSDIPSLDLWNSEEQVEILENNLFTFGIHVKMTVELPTTYHVFTRMTVERKGEHFLDFPSPEWVSERVRGLRKQASGNSFSVLIAEAGGSASLPGGLFQKSDGSILTIQPNTKCPQELHDEWYVLDKNLEDPTTAGVKFKTWHPQWDPCYWCAYDHDHGSSPKHICGHYDPKYDYVAKKNYNQSEAHEGFKGVVFIQKNLCVYVGFHSQTSSMGRVSTRFHTLVIAVVDLWTTEIVLEVGQKADFGYVVGLRTGRKFVPLRLTDKELAEENRGSTQKIRSITVYNPDDPALSAMFNTRSPQEAGQYEEWNSVTTCMKSRPQNSRINIVLKQPVTGTRRIDVIRRADRIYLGRQTKNLPVAKGENKTRFILNTSQSRMVVLKDLEISEMHCPLGQNGTFYTDPFGNPTAGPSQYAVRQFIKPGFTLKINNRYEVQEQWLGLYSSYSRNFFQDHGYGINPKIN